MTTIQESQASSRRINFDLNIWVSENITKNWILTVWLILLTLFTVQFTRSQLELLI